MADDEIAAEETPGYKAPEKVDTDTLMNKDADDEALTKWKQKLMEGSNAAKGDGPNVVVEKLSLVVEGRDDVDLDLTKSLDAIKAQKFVIKEGCDYRLKITFKVNNEIVAGLKYLQAVHRKGIRVDKSQFMVGSYGPKAESQTYLSPVESAPSGMMLRGSYTVKSKFIDDDKNAHLEWTWSFDIKKQWA